MAVAAGCAAAPEEQSSSASPLVSLSVSDAWQYAGMGGMGAFPDIQAFPGDANVLFSAANVGGINVSTDGGASWKNISGGLATSMVERIAFSRRVRTDVPSSSTKYTVLLGTDLGVYYSQEVDASTIGSTSWSWTLVRPGVDTSTAATDLSSEDIATPVLSLTVDPSEPTRVWLGIGYEYQFDSGSTTNRKDKWKLYTSLDGGITWSPSLRFSAGSDAADIGNVYEIKVHPTNSKKVWATTDQGLYFTNDRGSTWYETGIKNRRHTKDKGVTWTDLALTTCASSPLSSTCLPITGDSTHPDLRDISLTQVSGALGAADVLYAAAWDRGYATVSSCDSEGFFVDSSLKYYRGGIYRSTDDGLTWTWMFKDASGTSTMTDVNYRCSEDAKESGGSNFIQVESPPTATQINTGYVVAGGYGYGSKGAAGIYLGRLSTGSWTRQTDDTKCPSNDCFEGNAAGGLWGTHDRTAGAALRASWVDVSQPPTIYYSYRGYSKGEWNKSTSRYEFALLHGNPVSGSTAWNSTGLDDAVATPMVFVGTELYVGIMDGAVIKADMSPSTTKPSLWNWTRPGASWSVKSDDTKAMVVDGKQVVAANYWQGEINILRSDTTRTSWSVIGGYGSSSSFSGLSVTVPDDAKIKPGIYDLAVDQQATTGKRYLAGTTNGLWLYSENAAGTSGTWALAENCPTTSGSTLRQAVHIVAQANYSLVSFLDGASVVDGIYVVDTSLFESGGITKVKCTRIGDKAGDPRATIRQPSGFALGDGRLIVSSTKNNTPRVYSAPFSTSSPTATLTWTLAADANGLLDPSASDYAGFQSVLGKYSFDAITVSPTNTSLVVAAINAGRGLDYSAAPSIYVSTDGGATFGAQNPKTLPVKNVNQFAFDPSGNWLYASSSASVYRLVASRLGQ